MKIQPSKKLYEILEEAYRAEAHWDALEKLGVHARVTNSGDGPPDLIEDILNLVEEGCHELQPDTQYVVCPDPMNHDSSKFFHILFFPKELAEKIMILRLSAHWRLGRIAMKWNKSNKKKVWQTLQQHVRQNDCHDWLPFLETFGIIVVYRGSQICSPSMTWLQREDDPGRVPVYVDPWGQGYKPASSRKHIIIDDIINSNPGWGYKIPKEVAEKLLVLGVP